MPESKIFVYGTLMENFRNYEIYLKGKTISISKAYIYGQLYHLGAHDCPAIVDGKDKVYGQVIRFYDDEANTVLNQIDKFEKYFFDGDDIIYERVPVKVYYMDETIEELSFYKFKNKNRLEKEAAEYVSSGDWKAFKHS